MKRLINVVFGYVFGMQYHLIWLYRLARFLRFKIPLVGPQMSVSVRHLMRVYTACDISPLADIAPGVSFPHPSGIVIGDGVRIATGCKIWQQVTIGSHGKKGEEARYPVIGNNVRIYAKASIIGSVDVGRGAIIGAHSLVLKDVPEGKTAAGVPAQVI